MTHSVSMQGRARVVTCGFTRLLIGGFTLFASLTTVAEPIKSEGSRTDSCKVSSSATNLLEVRCPAASVADLLNILEKSTGLRSEYPRELASARVSVNLPRASLLEVLESALSAFNFAVWIDQESPSAIWLRIVDLRGAIARPLRQVTYEQTGQSSPRASPTAIERPLQQVTYEQTGQSSPSASPTPSTSLTPENNEADMAWERERFAHNITTTYPLEPGPVQESGMLSPVPETLGTEPDAVNSQ